eukprot:CAMPEP_0169102626 /NCGR_PEP_ID=MMETSP1015-20121227/22269_1 /TAXON_ID=342587 /ORGANISM="Karlodinium micrum, Strain CCMP2283" /LENGTH=272 /DNA_ID=CAMNT_0009163743 /DNA_START=34 /DNA_END=852 /DNA_ORIENTATION=+
MESVDPARVGAGAPSGTVDGIAQSLQTNLGVGAGTAQVLTWIAILAVCWVLIQVVQKKMFDSGKKKRRKRGNVLLLLGQCGSGKTALFYRLQDEVDVASVSSLKETRAKLQIATTVEGEKLGPIETIDYPGHQRLRGKQEELYQEAKCIIYMVDAEDKDKMKDVAEHLYELFTSQEIIDLQIPILLACNKIDSKHAQTEKFIVEKLEREIEQMRVSRGATLDNQDQAASYLGIEGEKFKFRDHCPCPFELCRISVKKPELDPVYEFLRTNFS